MGSSPFFRRDRDCWVCAGEEKSSLSLNPWKVSGPWIRWPQYAFSISATTDIRLTWVCWEFLDRTALFYFFFFLIGKTYLFNCCYYYGCYSFIWKWKHGSHGSKSCKNDQCLMEFLLKMITFLTQKDFEDIYSPNQGFNSLFLSTGSVLTL